MQKNINFPASLKSVSEFTASLDTLFASLPTETRTGIVLAIQELCVNIVNHAYAGHTGEIRLEIQHNDVGLLFTITDDAPNPYIPPETINEPDPLDLPEHGMGMFIIHQIFDRVEYERRAAGNCWRLAKTSGV